MSDFWLQVSTEYSNLSEAVTVVLVLGPIAFTTPNLCEAGFSADSDEN